MFNNIFAFQCHTVMTISIRHRLSFFVCGFFLLLIAFLCGANAAFSKVLRPATDIVGKSDPSASDYYVFGYGMERSRRVPRQQSEAEAPKADNQKGAAAPMFQSFGNDRPLTEKLDKVSIVTFWDSALTKSTKLRRKFNAKISFVEKNQFLQANCKTQSI